MRRIPPERRGAPTAASARRPGDKENARDGVGKGDVVSVWRKVEETSTVLVDMPAGLRRWWRLACGRATVRRQTYTASVWVRGPMTPANLRGVRMVVANGPILTLQVPGDAVGLQVSYRPNP